MRQATSTILCATVLCALGCNGDGRESRLSIGKEPTHAGKGTGSGGSLASGPAGAPGTAMGTVRGDELAVRVEDIRKMTIEVVTVACAGDCADVEAVASGGNPPYAFAWSDGVSRAAREICVDHDAVFTVEASDTPIDDDEFRHEQQHAEARVTTTVLDCPSDAGVDAGGDPRTPTSCSLADLGLPTCSQPDGQVNEQPGRSIMAGVPEGIVVTGDGNFSDQGWHYEVWGSLDGCSLDEKLTEFQLTNGPIDIQRCFVASRDYPSVLLFYRYAPTDGVSLSVWNVDYCEACTGTP